MCILTMKATDDHYDLLEVVPDGEGQKGSTMHAPSRHCPGAGLCTNLLTYTHLAALGRVKVGHKIPANRFPLCVTQPYFNKGPLLQ
jgi:hypothetical protein